MKSHVFVMLVLALTVLAGCFMSVEPRIKTGTLLATGPVAFCMPDEEPCQTGVPDGDGYRIVSDRDGEEDVRLRFEALTEADGSRIFLGEVELSDGEDAAWSYVVARASGETPEGRAQFDLVMPGCSDMDADESARFGLVRADAYSCTVSDLERFRAYLIEVYTDDFADPGFWASAN